MEEEKIENENIVEVEKIENVESETMDNENEGIQIANDVISTIAGKAVLEVAGVAEMAGGFAGGISEVLSGKKNLSKGIRVDINGKDVKIDVNIIVEYGIRIPDVAFEIQNKVKNTVENFTGLKVLNVNVRVQGVRMIEQNEDVVEEAKETENDINNETNEQ